MVGLANPFAAVSFSLLPVEEGKHRWSALLPRPLRFVSETCNVSGSKFFVAMTPAEPLYRDLKDG